MQRTTLPACAGGTLGSADLLHNLPPAKTTGTTTQCPMRSPSVRRWEMANKFHSNSQQTNLPPSYSKMISVQEKGSSGHHISWLRKAFDTITFNFHIRQMRKLKLNENSQLWATGLWLRVTSPGERGDPTSKVQAVCGTQLHNSLRLSKAILLLLEGQSNIWVSF